jgi:hypothetical protein
LPWVASSLESRNSQEVGVRKEELGVEGVGEVKVFAERLKAFMALIFKNAA